MSTNFPMLALVGSPYDIGLAHGIRFKDRIIDTICFYRKTLQADGQTLLWWGEYFRKQIYAFNPAYNEEIEGIALGAGVDRLWIYVLNARSELRTRLCEVNECTSMYFPKTSLLGQNWDWSQTLERLAVLVNIKRPDGHQILMMVEPGFIGKIGFNSAGIGVCLNSLKHNVRADGLPIHVLLRAILDCTSIDEAKEVILANQNGKVGNVLVGDNNGQYTDFEFAGNEMFPLHNDDSAFLHTNHYLGKRINTNPLTFASSFARYKRGRRILERVPDHSIDSMKSILLDRKGLLPICRRYGRHPQMGSFGTVCSIIMDLPNLKMHITKGSPRIHDFETVGL